MDSAQALALVALLQAYFPVPELPQSTQTVWANALTPYDYEPAQTAVHRLGRGRVARGPLQLAEVLDVCDEVRQESYERVYQMSEARARELMSELVAMAPEEIRRHLAPYWERFGGDEEGRLLATWDRVKDGPDREAKIEAGRALARARIAAEGDPKREGQLKPITESTKRLVRGVDLCTGVGKLGVKNKAGELCCPDCGSPIAEGCRPSATRRSA